MTNEHPRFVKCWVDGGVLGRNPSPRGVYWSVHVELGGSERPVTVRRRVLVAERPLAGFPLTPCTLTTNNDAEWMALRQGLVWLVKRRVKLPVVIYSDSLGIIGQFTGKLDCHLEFNTRLREECRMLAAKLKWVELEWRPRDVMVRKLGH